MGMLGGMMMASDAATDVSPAVNAGGYPFCTMAGMMMLPIAATSATAEPEISAKNIDEATLTMSSPPRGRQARGLDEDHQAGAQRNGAVDPREPHRPDAEGGIEGGRLRQRPPVSP